MCIRDRGSGVDGRMHHRPRVMDLAAIGFSGNLVLSAVRASRGQVRLCPLPLCRRSKLHNVDIGVAPRVVEGFISDFRIHQFGFPCANRVQNRFPLSMSKHLQLEHTRRNRVTEPVTRASCKPHFHIPTWMVPMPPASHFITVELASTLHFTC